MEIIALIANNSFKIPLFQRVREIELEEGYTQTVDRKSMDRILLLMHNEKKIKIFKTMIMVDDKESMVMIFSYICS